MLKTEGHFVTRNRIFPQGSSRNLWGGISQKPADRNPSTADPASRALELVSGNETFCICSVCSLPAAFFSLVIFTVLYLQRFVPTNGCPSLTQHGFSVQVTHQLAPYLFQFQFPREENPLAGTTYLGAESFVSESCLKPWLADLSLTTGIAWARGGMSSE